VNLISALQPEHGPDVCCGSFSTVSAGFVSRLMSGPTAIPAMPRRPRIDSRAERIARKRDAAAQWCWGKFF
jgi:hypothetical protein